MKKLLLLPIFTLGLLAACSSLPGKTTASLPGKTESNTPPRIVKIDGITAWNDPSAFGPVPQDRQVSGNGVCQSMGFASAIGYHRLAQDIDGTRFPNGGYFCGGRLENTAINNTPSTAISATTTSSAAPVSSNIATSAAPVASAVVVTNALPVSTLVVGESMTFSLANVCTPSGACQFTVIGNGRIDPATPTKFVELTKALPQKLTVLLNSDEGDLQAGMDLGKAIRARYFNTKIGIPSNSTGNSASSKSTQYSPGKCISGCALAFLGGVSRSIDPRDIYGFNGMTGVATQTQDNQKTLASIGQYVELMGGNRRLIDTLLSSKENQIQRIPYATAKQLNIDNQGASLLLPWQMKTTNKGNAISFVSEKQVAGRLSVTLALAKLNSGNPSRSESINLIVFIKPIKGAFSSSEINAFTSEPTLVQVRSGSTLANGNVTGPWARNQEGIQAVLSLPESFVEDLAQYLTFDLEIQMPRSIVQADKTTKFSTAGLKSALSNLKK